MAPDPNYSILGALNASGLGYVVQPEQIDLAYAQYEENGYAPLTPAQVAAILLEGAEEVQTWFEENVVGKIIPPGTDPYPDPVPPLLPAPAPAGCPVMFPMADWLPRIPDSNEEPFDDWVEFGAELVGWEY